MDWFISLFKLILYSTVLASILAVVILMLKFILRKRLGVQWHYCIWLLLLIRLIIPYAPQSEFSAFNLFTTLQSKSSQVKSISNYSMVKPIISLSEKQTTSGTNQTSKNDSDNVAVGKYSSLQRG